MREGLWSWLKGDLTRPSALISSIELHHVITVSLVSNESSFQHISLGN